MGRKQEGELDPDKCCKQGEEGAAYCKLAEISKEIETESASVDVLAEKVAPASVLIARPS